MNAPHPQHKGSWRNERALGLMSEDLKDLMDKMFELDPVGWVEVHRCVDIMSMCGCVNVDELGPPVSIWQG